MMKAESKTTPREKEVFLEALDKRDAAERAAYLDAACTGAPELRRAVDQLLQEANEVAGFLETPAVDCDPAKRGSAGGALAAELLEKPGDRIGNYRLLQKIGEGGCGAVYMAEQEQPVRRRVALKIIKLGMDTKQVIARFDAERQALAMMEHPNIARVLEAGATETGRPYFVMELVRGIKITEYCDQNKLSTDERLKLFLQVCQAIQHAHQKGIIHRDIKPSNILVTSHDGTPVPKVIDFGVAKATNQQKLTDLTIFTAFEQFIGTPAYMSPEQAEMSGLDVDTRSDIYSLGVLLYELLTGSPPFDPQALMRGGLDECRRTIREVEPVWPSTRVSTLMNADLSLTANLRQAEPPRLLSLLRGDLDWIVMKALEKDRTRRYATANDLAQDVENYLGNEPVLARPQGSWYRLGKLLRRHQKVVGAAAGIALILVVGAAISIWQALRAHEAELQAQSAQKIEAGLRRQAELDELYAREQAALARLNEYVADVNLAQQSLSAGNFGRAVQLLEKHRPKSDREVAPFEWRYLWQLSRGDEHLNFPRQEGSVQCLAYSPSGDAVAVGLPEKLIILDTRTQARLAALPRRAISLSFLPNGKSLVAAGPTSVRVYNTADWSEQRELDRCSGPMALSADGSRLAVSTREGARVLDTSTWKPVASLRDARGTMEFSPDGGHLAVQSREGIEVHQLAGSAQPVVLENSTNLFFGGGPWFRPGRLMAFSPDGKSIVAARNTRSARGYFYLSIWDAQTGKETGTLPPDPKRPEHTGMIAALDFSPDGKTLATASMDHSVRLWNFAERRAVETLHAHLNEVWAVAFAPDGKTLISGAKDGGLKAWPVRRQKRENVMAGGAWPLGFSPDSRTLAAITPRRDAVLFLNVATGEAERQVPLEAQRFPRFPGSVAVSADLTTVAQATQSGVVKLWNSENGEAVELKASEGPIGMVILSGDGRQLVTGAFQHPMRWWDLRSGTSITLDARARRGVFSPDGRTLAVFGMETGIQLWDVATRTVRTNAVLQSTSIGTVVFSPDSRLLAATGNPENYENSIYLWDTLSGKPAGVCAGHKQAVFSVAFSPDGRTLASSSDDATVKLWNVATQQELLTAQVADTQVTDLHFSPDGTLLAGANGGFMEANGIRLFRAPIPQKE